MLINTPSPYGNFGQPMMSAPQLAALMQYFKGGGNYVPNFAANRPDIPQQPNLLGMLGQSGGGMGGLMGMLGGGAKNLFGYFNSPSSTGLGSYDMPASNYLGNIYGTGLQGGGV